MIDESMWGPNCGWDMAEFCIEFFLGLDWMMHGSTGPMVRRVGRVVIR